MPPTRCNKAQSLRSSGEQLSQGKILEEQGDIGETHRNFLDGQYTKWTKQLEERLKGLLELKQRLSKQPEIPRVKEETSGFTQEEPISSKGATGFLAESAEKDQNTAISCANEPLQAKCSKQDDVSGGDCRVFVNAARTDRSAGSAASSTHQLRHSRSVKYRSLWNSSSCNHLSSAEERESNSSSHEVPKSKLKDCKRLGAGSGKKNENRSNFCRVVQLTEREHLILSAAEKRWKAVEQLSSCTQKLHNVKIYLRRRSGQAHVSGINYHPGMQELLKLIKQTTTWWENQGEADGSGVWTKLRTHSVSVPRATVRPEERMNAKPTDADSCGKTELKSTRRNRLKVDAESNRNNIVGSAEHLISIKVEQQEENLESHPATSTSEMVQNLETGQQFETVKLTRGPHKTTKIRIKTEKFPKYAVQKDSVTTTLDNASEGFRTDTSGAAGVDACSPPLAGFSKGLKVRVGAGPVFKKPRKESQNNAQRQKMLARGRKRSPSSREKRIQEHIKSFYNPPNPEILPGCHQQRLEQYTYQPELPPIPHAAPYLQSPQINTLPGQSSRPQQQIAAFRSPPMHIFAPRSSPPCQPPMRCMHFSPVEAPSPWQPPPAYLFPIQQWPIRPPRVSQSLHQPRSASPAQLWSPAPTNSATTARLNGQTRRFTLSGPPDMHGVAVDSIVPVPQIQYIQATAGHRMLLTCRCKQ